jgi:hypothetical protein
MTWSLMLTLRLMFAVVLSLVSGFVFAQRQAAFAHDRAAIDKFHLERRGARLRLTGRSNA